MVKMSTPLKKCKETEEVVHEQLYNNIFLLTHFYPTTNEFNGVFKRNMFVKHNKAAFNHVVYYLLNILNPELTKEKITAWPLYDVKLEKKFRVEVSAFINQLNFLYENANIPNIMSSHLIFPGGYKFVKFMLKLSQFVLFQHLSKKEVLKLDLLSPIKPNKNTSATNVIMNNLKQKTDGVEMEVKQYYEKFQQNCENAVGEANIVASEQTQLNEDFNKVNTIHEARKNTFNKETYSAVVKSVTQNVDNFKNKIVDMKNVENLCKRNNELLTYLLSDDSMLEYKNSELSIPKNIAHLISTDSEKLDLLKLFNGLNAILEAENVEMPVYTTYQLNDMVKIITEINDKYSQLNEKLTINRNKLSEAVDIVYSEVEPVMERHREAIPVAQLHAGDETLAVPLEDFF